jgi:hypothetical protein
LLLSKKEPRQAIRSGLCQSAIQKDIFRRAKSSPKKQLHQKFSYIPAVIISIGFLYLGCYFRKRIAKISALDDNSICLISKEKKILLHKNDILCIRQMVRFSLSERMWLMITFFNQNKKRERWLFQGEPNLGLMDEFKKMGVRLKNIS